MHLVDVGRTEKVELELDEKAAGARGLLYLIGFASTPARGSLAPDTCDSSTTLS